MDAIKIDIAGTRRVGLRFDEFPDQLRDDFVREITSLSAELLVRIEAVTPDRTGKLRSQETVHVFNDPNQVKGNVFVAGVKGSQDFAKAGAEEYGAHRATQVKAHSMSLDHHWSEKLAAPMTVLVRAYSRTPDIAEAAFLRGPLAAMGPEVVARLNAVVDKAVAQANA